MSDLDAFGLPPLKTGLTASIERLRATVKPDKARRAPPEENGVRLATIPRSDDEELRLSWAEYNGRHFLNVRMWTKSGEGWFPQKDKGLTVRLHELADFADGIAKAVDLASQGGRGNDR